MNAGLLWYDDDPERSLPEKVRRAAHHYECKFGVPAQVCYVHPSALEVSQAKAVSDEVRIAALDTVLTNHLWVGREEKTASARPRAEKPRNPDG